MPFIISFETFIWSLWGISPLDSWHSQWKTSLIYRKAYSQRSGTQPSLHISVWSCIMLYTRFLFHFGTFRFALIIMCASFFLFLIFLRTTGNTIFHHVLNINANWWTCSCGLYHQIRRQTKILSTLQTKYQLFAFPSLHAGIVYTCWPAFVEPFKPSVFQWLA